VKDRDIVSMISAKDAGEHTHLIDLLAFIAQSFWSNSPTR
jgi:hypothetical protein